MSQKFIKHLIANNLILLLAIAGYNLLSIWLPITKIHFLSLIVIIIIINLFLYTIRSIISAIN